MIERAYTVGEIDGLRAACSNKWLWGSYRGPQVFAGGSGGNSRSYREEELVACVEQMVRTHMLAGQTAADLYASEAAPEAAR